MVYGLFFEIRMTNTSSVFQETVSVQIATGAHDLARSAEEAYTDVSTPTSWFKFSN